ncbi:hypothetical protein LguiB_016643 [Lonicera macranthoides]
MEIQIQRDIHQIDGNGRTPLHIAASRGNLEGVINILSTRPELATEVELNGASPLHLVSANGHLQIVRHLLLVEVNQDTCLLPDNNETRLFIWQTAVVNRLLDVNQDTCLLHDKNENTPLHVAANSRHIDVATLFIGQLSQQQLVQGEIKDTANVKKYVIRCGSHTLQQFIESDSSFLNGCDDKYHNTLLHTVTGLRSKEVIYIYIYIYIYLNSFFNYIYS